MEIIGHIEKQENEWKGEIPLFRAIILGRFRTHVISTAQEMFYQLLYTYFPARQILEPRYNKSMGTFYVTCCDFCISWIGTDKKMFRVECTNQEIFDRLLECRLQDEHLKDRKEIYKDFALIRYASIL